MVLEILPRNLQVTVSLGQARNTWREREKGGEPMYTVGFFTAKATACDSAALYYDSFSPASLEAAERETYGKYLKYNVWCWLGLG